MFDVMNKKWLKRGLILGAFAVVAYVFLEIFFWDYIAVRRFLKEEKIANKYYFDNKNTFDEIRLLSVELPNYDLDLNEQAKNYLTLDLKENNTLESNDTSYFYYSNLEFLQGAIDSIINDERWFIKVENAPNDTLYREALIFFKHNFTKFEKIKDGIKQINSTHISNIKNRSLHIRFKENICEGLQYSYYRFNYSKQFIRKVININ